MIVTLDYKVWCRYALMFLSNNLRRLATHDEQYTIGIAGMVFNIVANKALH